MVEGVGRSKGPEYETLGLMGSNLEIGERIFNLERMYNLREGLTGADDTLPPRMLHEPTFKHMQTGHPLAQLLPRYYKLRGWDQAGVPTRRTLERLQLRV
jgi:aldehyde:ferredoxin oxidoreductase